MRLPNFLCIGAQKAGTTLLYEVLNLHPQIFLPKVKEVHFFDVDDNFDKGIEWYKKYFSGSEKYSFVGEITPAYIFFKYVPQRIRETLGTEIKLLVMLRNPIDRAYSHYWMAFRRGYEQLPFEEAIMKEDSRIRNGYPDTHRFSYVSRGFYSEQFKRYLSFFPIKNIKVTLFEEFVKDKENNIGEILNFLGCTEAFEFEINNKIHSGDLNLHQYIRAVKTNRYYSLRSNFLNMIKLLTSQGKKVDYPPVRRKTRLALFDLFKNDIHELEILLNKDLSIWREY